MPLRLLFKDEDKFDLTDIRMHVSRELFKEYKRIHNALNKLETELLDAEMNNDREQIQKIQEKIEKKKLKKLHFKIKYGIAKKELASKIKQINNALANNEKIILPKAYKKILNEFKMLKCPNCGTFLILTKKNITPACHKCNTYINI